jgi:Protein of unknown function (DUF3775)
MPELQIARDKLGLIIAKAREYDVQVAPVDEDSGSNPTDDGEADVLQENPDNPVREELTAAIDALNVDERIDVVALTWIGRGDYDVEQWREARAAAAQAQNGRPAAYLTGIPLLADYLEEALTGLGIAAEDISAEES